MKISTDLTRVTVRQLKNQNNFEKFLDFFLRKDPEQVVFSLDREPTT